MKCTKHHWKNLTSARSICKDQPETHDTITSFLFCPKCTDTISVVHKILRERPDTSEGLELLMIKLKSLRPSLNQDDIIIVNLRRLGYSHEEVLNITKTKENEILTVDLLKSRLLQTHRVLAEDILTKRLL